MKITDVNNFDYDLISKTPVLRRPPGNPGGNKARYLDAVTGFDIETTSDHQLQQAFMYVWQFQYDLECSVVGRTWEEFFSFLLEIVKRLKDNVYLVCYIHNASFEFQFLKGLYHFEPEEVFATDSRKVLKFTMFDHIEFRCNYLHTNMSLAEYTRKMGVKDHKLSGELFDYSKQRYPWTPLSDYELQYCINDVLGMVEALKIEMKADGDNLYTVPLTSTGYVRRDCKKAMKQYNHKQLYAMLPNEYIYGMLREAFRGGNTHANRWYAGEIMKDVISEDRSSSYPDVMVNCEFPMGPFYHEGASSLSRVKKLIEVRHKAVLMRIAFQDLELRSRYDGAPYLSRDKGRNIINGVYDNGRVLSCDYGEWTLTDVDFRIVLQHYTWSGCNPYDIAHARYGRLPDPLIQTVNHYYKLKTELKGVAGQEIYYMKAKNKLNSLYGMTAQDPVKDSIDFIDDAEEPYQLQDKPLAELLHQSYKKAFLSYAWGVWTTAWARYRLQEAIDLCGTDFIYTDTDSVKHLGEIDLSAYNDQRKQDSMKNGAYAVDGNGEVHYMGVFEPEAHYDRFSTLGAKKYVGECKGKLEITIAGVNKKKGAEELGSIENFKEGFTFYKAGGTESKYNDNINMLIEREGKIIRITDNVYIRDSTYTLGLTAEYLAILNGLVDIKYSDHNIPGLYKMKNH